MKINTFQRADWLVMFASNRIKAWEKDGHNTKRFNNKLSGWGVSVTEKFDEPLQYWAYVRAWEWLRLYFKSNTFPGEDEQWLPIRRQGAQLGYTLNLYTYGNICYATLYPEIQKGDFIEEDTSKPYTLFSMILDPVKCDFCGGIFPEDEVYTTTDNLDSCGSCTVESV